MRADASRKPNSSVVGSTKFDKNSLFFTVQANLTTHFRRHLMLPDPWINRRWGLQFQTPACSACAAWDLEEPDLGVEPPIVNGVGRLLQQNDH